MKTVYMKPTTTVVEIKTQSLMTVSGGGSGSVSNVTVSEDTYDSGAGEILSRGGSFWDDEE